MPEFPFLTYDVFTEIPFGGNPLAVFPGARNIDRGLFQTIAREFNLSETTFVTPVEGKPLSRSVRIFTPSYELPFAGHPTVGTAIALAEMGAFPWPTAEPALTITLEEQAGPVPVRKRIARIPPSRVRSRRSTVASSSKEIPVIEIFKVIVS